MCLLKHLRIRLTGLAVFLILGWTASTWGWAASGPSISIELESGSFKVAGWHAPQKPPSAGWQSIFAVYTGSGNVPPLLGSYTVLASTLFFHPQFPFSPGVHYRAVFHPPGGSTLERTFDGPPHPTKPMARVDRFYPSGDILPSNQLRLYIYFSAPMSRGEAGARIHLLDEDGQELHDVFLPGEELWDPNYQRLTITLDPGRIKRGLTSNMRLGPPIAPGKRYTLVIDRDWPDARGVPMIEGFRKGFRGGPAIRTPPDPKQWHLLAPKAGTAAPLIVDFPAAMNYPLLERMLRVSSSNGTVPGAVKIDRHETEWRFTPQEPWKPGEYRLIVETGLEDLAGNHIGQAFDIDTFHRITEHITTESIPLGFAVRP